MSSAVRTDPALWERVKRKVTKSPKGGPPGKWSARKAQIAVALYKKSGGSYKGKKSPKNSLVKWTREDWGYISPNAKSGRYLPLNVRKHLSPNEKRRENRLKGRKKGQHIPYSESVLKKFRKYTKK